MSLVAVDSELLAEIINNSFLNKLIFHNIIACIELSDKGTC